MSPALRSVRNFFVSLQLTVVLLSLSLILVFFATWDQKDLGIWTVQQKWFHSFFVIETVGLDLSLKGFVVLALVIGAVLVAIRLIWSKNQSVEACLNGFVLTAYCMATSGVVMTYSITKQPIPVPVLPGGYLIGGLLLLNLIAAHIYRFKLTWRKTGIQLAHAGVILLLFGELISGLMQKDSTMQLIEGETMKYSESFRDHELVLIDQSNPDYDQVVAIPEAVLADKSSLQHPKLPFLVRVKEFYPNANVQMRDASTAPNPDAPVTGLGNRIALIPLPITYRPDENNHPGAYVELTGTDGPLGTWLVSPLLGAPQTFSVQGRTWSVALRLKRFYQPFSISLLKVTHDVYPGTEIPKNFASRVRVHSDDGKDDRETTIYMNNPLRFGGKTFYQYQMNAANQMSAFQVVSNPGWLLPYIACIMMGFGLIIQFGTSLFAFINKRASAVSATT